jgi:hypothetical protein
MGDMTKNFSRSEVAKSQNATLDILRSHAEKSEKFHDTYSKAILRKLEHLKVSDG